MNRSRQLQLQKELLAAGASRQELKSLLPIADGLQHVKLPSPQPAAHRAKLAFMPKISVLIPVGLAGLVAGVFLILIAQSALPDSPLYAVQKISDNVLISMNPDYRATVMMKRAEQVHELAERHASSGAILAALHDYDDQAQVYKSSSDEDYGAFEYCKTNLRQASKQVAPDVQQAIIQSLQSLDTT